MSSFFIHCTAKSFAVNKKYRPPWSSINLEIQLKRVLIPEPDKPLQQAFHLCELQKEALFNANDTAAQVRIRHLFFRLTFQNFPSVFAKNLYD